MPAPPPLPLSLKKDGDGLRIHWADGAVTIAPFKALRAGCPCASCVEDRAKPPDPFKLLSAAEIAAGAPAPVAMAPVGHYAYQITWNDGHSTGIYTLDTLRSLGHPAPGT